MKFRYYFLGAILIFFSPIPVSLIFSNGIFNVSIEAPASAIAQTAQTETERQKILKQADELYEKTELFFHEADFASESGTEEEIETALKDLEKLLAIYEKFGDGDIGSKHNVLFSICTNSDSFKDANQAIKYCKQYINLLNSKDLVFNGFSSAYGLGLISLSNAYTKTENYSEAINVLKEGIEIASMIKDVVLRHSLLMKIASIYFISEDYTNSAQYYRQALNISNKGVVSEGAVASESKIRERLGWALLYQGNLIEAEKEFLAAAKTHEDERDIKSVVERGFGSQLHHLATEDTTQYFIYAGLQELRVKQGRHEEALEFAERNRTRFLINTLSGKLDFPKIKQIRDVAKKQNSTLVEYSIIRNRKKIRTQEKAEDKLFIWVAKPNGKIHFRQVDLNHLIVTYQLESHDLEKINSSQQKILIQTVILIFNVSVTLLLLRRRKILFVIGITASAISALSLTLALRQSINPHRSETTHSPLNKTSISSFSNLTQTTVNSVRDERNGIPSESFEQGTCQEQDECLEALYQILIQPIAELLPKNPQESIVFLPDRELFKVPFSALKTPKGKYLIEKYAIRIAPSIRLLEFTKKKSEQKLDIKSYSTTDNLVVGNPLMPGIQKLNSYFEPQAPENLAPLPGTEKEAQAVAEILGTTPLIGTQATELAVMSQISKARIIHLATHGVQRVYIPSQQSTRDILALTPSQPDTVHLDPSERTGQNSNNTNFKDGLLTPDDIYSTNLKAELVVLSACDTGLGFITTDGVLSLTRPFLAGGVPSVVVSLWKVPDDATAELMVEFYRNLQSTPDKAQALRQAMLTTMKKYPDPKSWAAFTLVGES